MITATTLQNTAMLSSAAIHSRAKTSVWPCPRSPSKMSSLAINPPVGGSEMAAANASTKPQPATGKRRPTPVRSLRRVLPVFASKVPAAKNMPDL